MKQLLVILDNVVAARLSQLADGRLRLEYTDEHRSRPDATPLSLSMPTAVGDHPHKVVAPWLRGLLPDNEAVLRRWGREFQVSPTSPFALLGTPIGEDCAGAVRFAPEAEVERVLARTGTATPLTTAEVAGRLRDLQADSTAWFGQSSTGQFSLAGAQAKTALSRVGNGWVLPQGATPSTHILKPAVAGFDDHDLNEHLCLDAARRAGLLVAPTRVEQFEDVSVVVVTRYDRRATAGEVIRVHQEDLCQALSINADDKYQNAGGPGPRQIARLLREAMPASVADDAVRRFADALIWNWLIAGTDAHAKNYSLLLAGDQVRLAPIYDVASALPYGFNPLKLRFAMKLGSSYDVFGTSNPWPAVARDLGLDGEMLTERARTLLEAAPAAFADAAAAVADLGRPLPARLADLVTEHADRNRKLLQTRPAEQREPLRSKR